MIKNEESSDAKQMTLLQRRKLFPASYTVFLQKIDALRLDTEAPIDLSSNYMPLDYVEVSKT